VINNFASGKTAMNPIFKYALAAVFLLFAASVSAFHSRASADDCLQRFQKLVTQPDWDLPIRTRFSSQTGDGPIYRAETISNAWDHQLTIPEGDLPQSLNYKGGLFMSNDKGKTWQKINGFDPEKSKQDAAIGMQKNAESASNVTCRQETLNGVSVDVLEGDLENIWPAKSNAHHVMYVEDTGGFVVRTISTITLPGGLITVVEHNSELIDEPQLPKPE